MSGFIDRIFGSKLEVDLVKANLESRMSFEYSQLDKELLAIVLEKSKMDGYAPHQKKLFALSATEKINIEEEVFLLSSYIDLVRQVRSEDFYLQFNVKVSDTKASVSPLILFPLVQNVVKNGYASLEKFPIKIRLSVSEGGALLEVSNRVNHYLQNQAEDEIIQLYKQRLFMNYTDKYDLFMNSNANTFKATLFLKF